MSSGQAVGWSEALRDFERHQTESGLGAGSADRQLRQLRRVARHFGGTPAAVSSAQLTRWLSEHPGAASTVKSERITLRAFFRWAELAGIVPVTPMPAPAPVTRYGLDERWQDALDAFEGAQVAARIAPATIAQRLKHLGRFAGEVQAAPWAVDGRAIQAWLDGLDVAPLTRQAHRTSMRAFYRWGHGQQLIATNPAAAPERHPLYRGAPAEWAPELEAYMRAGRAQGRPASTLATRRAQLERFAREHRGQHPYSLTLDDLLEWLAGKSWAAETRRAMRSTVAGFYAWAEATGRVESSPARELPSIRPAQPRPRPALEHELHEALAKSSPRQRLAVRLAAELGLRRAEGAQVHSRDVVRMPGDDQWWLRVHGKGARQRTVPLTDDLASALRGVPAGWAFPNGQGGHLSAGYLSKQVSELLPEGVTMHALRHRFATQAYNVDRDVFAVQRFLGHASPTTTQRYVLVSDNNLRALGAAVAC